MLRPLPKVNVKHLKFQLSPDPKQTLNLTCAKRKVQKVYRSCYVPWASWELRIIAAKCSVNASFWRAQKRSWNAPGAMLIHGHSPPSNAPRVINRHSNHILLKLSPPRPARESWNVQNVAAVHIYLPAPCKVRSRLKREVNDRKMSNK